MKGGMNVSTSIHIEINIKHNIIIAGHQNRTIMSP